MRVLYIITRSTLGGAQVHLNELVAYCLLQKDVPFVIIGSDGWLAEKLRLQGVCVFLLPSLVREISPLQDIRALWGICQLIERIKPDIVHCHSSKAGILGRFAAWLKGVPTVFTAHGWAFTDGVKPYKRWIYRNLENLAGYLTTRIICVSEYDHQLGIRYLSQHGKKMITICNGIAGEAKEKRHFDKTDKSLELIMIARFDEQKDQLQVINAMQQVHVYNRNVHVFFVGKGPKLLETRKLVKQMELEETITFLGQREDIDSLLCSKDIFLLISHWEGFPISILEAMRAGLPVIASNVGGISEEVQNGVTGWLIPKGDYMYLARKILEIANDRANLLMMGAAGKKYFRGHFLADTMCRKVWTVYKECLEYK